VCYPCGVTINDDDDDDDYNSLVKPKLLPWKQQYGDLIEVF